MKILKILFLCLIFHSLSFAQELSIDAKALATNSYKQKSSVLEKLAKNYESDKRFLLLLDYMQKGKLYYVKETKELALLSKKSSNTYTITHFLSTNQEQKMGKKELKKVRINNRLRGVIKDIKNSINLFSNEKSVRLNAAKSLLMHIKKDDVDMIHKALLHESSSDVKEVLVEINTNLKALYKSGYEKLEAIEKLGGYLSSTSADTLNQLKNSTDEKVQKAAIDAYNKIEFHKKIYSYIQTAFFGLSLGSVLLLAAIGLAITFGVMKVINMAHGELIMIGAYCAYAVQQFFPHLLEYSVIIAIPVAFIVSGFFGILIERFVIRHLYNRPLETLLATFGISLVLQQLVRNIFSPLNQEVKTPSWMSGALEVNSTLSLTYNRLYIVIFSLIVFLGILFVMKKTSFGIKIRAVSQNRQTARAMGINSNFIDALTFGLGSGVAGVAGVALSQLTNVGPNLGQAYIIDSFMVVVFGGVGNLWGTLIAALSLGEITKFIEPLSGAVLAKVIVLVLIILFIQK